MKYDFRLGDRLRTAGQSGPSVPPGLVIASLLLSLAALLFPVLASEIPPLADYPNHLSRLWLLGGGALIAPVSEMYRVQWDTLTNIGVDLLGAAFAGSLGYLAVGRIAVFAAVFLPPLGGILLWRAIHRRWHWWQIAFILLPWGNSLLAGFLNFHIGIGLALLFAAGDTRLLRRRRPWVMVIIARAAMTAVLVLVHPFAALLYAALVAGLTLGAHPGLMRPAQLRRAAADLLILSTTVALPVLAFLLLTPHLPGTQMHEGLHALVDEVRAGLRQLGTAPITKLLRALIFIRAYSNTLDACTGLILIIPIVIAAVSGKIAVHFGLLLVCMALTACFVVCPDYLAGTYWIDTRFADMLPFALAAALAPELPRRSARLLALALFIVALIRTGSVGLVWQQRDADVASLARALAPVPPGAAVLALEQRPQSYAEAPMGRYTTIGETSFRHLPTLALPWQHAFVPTLFASRGKQPIEVLPPWNEIANPEGGWLADVHTLDDQEIPAYAITEESYLPLWKTRFDYILVVNADLVDNAGPFQPPPILQLVTDQGFARLYRILRNVQQ